ncbi:MAG TPA: hypothetical protein VF545_07300 [Thermoleophilaceae bacterium]
MPPLDPEIERVLSHLVERAQTVPRSEQQFFVFEVDQLPGSIVSGGGIEGQYQVADQDLRELRNYGLIQVDGNMRGSYDFFITQHGFAYAGDLRQRGEPLVRIEESVQGYLESSEFKARHSEAYAKWERAAALLAADPVENATRIGHDCREALQHFASSLVAQHGLALPGKGTFDSIGAVIEHSKSALGKRTHDLLAALLGLWKAATRVAQRQEHGSQREGAPLGPEDGRRCVWYTGLVMYELDRSLPPS